MHKGADCPPNGTSSADSTTSEIQKWACPEGVAFPSEALAPGPSHALLLNYSSKTAPRAAERVLQRIAASSGRPILFHDILDNARPLTSFVCKGNLIELGNLLLEVQFRLVKVVAATARL